MTDLSRVMRTGTWSELSAVLVHQEALVSRVALARVISGELRQFVVICVSYRMMKASPQPLKASPPPISLSRFLLTMAYPGAFRVELCFSFLSSIAAILMSCVIIRWLIS